MALYNYPTLNISVPSGPYRFVSTQILNPKKKKQKSKIKDTNEAIKSDDDDSDESESEEFLRTGNYDDLKLGRLDASLIIICNRNPTLFRKLIGTPYWSCKSICQIFAMHLGFKKDNEKANEEIYRILIYNKRFIRDKMIQHDVKENVE